MSQTVGSFSPIFVVPAQERTLLDSGHERVDVIRTVSVKTDEVCDGINTNQRHPRTNQPRFVCIQALWRAHSVQLDRPASNRQHGRYSAVRRSRMLWQSLIRRTRYSNIFYPTVIKFISHFLCQGWTGETYVRLDRDTGLVVLMKGRKERAGGGGSVTSICSRSLVTDSMFSSCWAYTSAARCECIIPRDDQTEHSIICQK